MTPAVLGRRYAPLMVLAAVQVMLVAVAPSGPASSSSPYANGFGGTNGGSAVAAGGSGAASGGALGGTSGAGGGAGADNSAFSSGSVSAGGGAAGTSGQPGSGATTGTGGAGGGGGTPGQLFNCGPNGLTIGPEGRMPPCTRVVPQSANGGTTMTGITSSKINFVYYIAQGNPEVNAILNTEGLAATTDQECQALQAFTKEVNKRWNLYGRQFVSLDGPGNHSALAEEQAGNGSCRFPFFQGQCSLTPPDPPCERAEADVIASMHPAYVVVPVADDALGNELAKNQVVFSGGYLGPQPDSYHTADAPYFWDWNTSGTWSAQMLAEYWCKKLNGHRVQWAGSGPGDVMSFGGIGAPPPLRKVAISYPATNGDPTTATSANLFLSLVNGGECQPLGGKAVGFPYQSDINSAQQQSTTTVAEMKQDHITDVIDFGDPIAPVFLSNTADQQGYHPEILLAGVGVIDYDVLGQLYNKNVWRNAFGVSELGTPEPFANTDAVKVWQDVGAPGQPDGTQNSNWAYFSLMATSFQMAGPNVNPGTIRAGLFGLPASGGDQFNPLIKFGEQIGPYTGVHDARETYWCATMASPIDNQPGTYVSVDNGKRYQLGQWTNSLTGVFPSGPCPG